MKVKIIKEVVLDCGTLHVGKVVDLSEANAAWVLHHKFAEKTSDALTAETAEAEPVAETTEAAPNKGGKVNKKPEAETETEEG